MYMLNKMLIQNVDKNRKQVTTWPQQSAQALLFWSCKISFP